MSTDELKNIKEYLSKMSTEQHLHVYRIINFYQQSVSDTKDNVIRTTNSMTSQNEVVIDLRLVSTECISAIKSFIKDTARIALLDVNTVTPNKKNNKTMATAVLANEKQRFSFGNAFGTSVPTMNQAVELCRQQKSFTPLQKQIKKRLKELKLTQNKYKKPTESDQRIMMSEDVDGAEVDGDDEEAVPEEGFDAVGDDFALDEDATTPDDTDGIVDADADADVPQSALFDEETSGSVDRDVIEDEHHDEKSECDDMILCGNDDIAIDLGKFTPSEAFNHGIQVLQDHGFEFGQVHFPVPILTKQLLATNLAQPNGNDSSNAISDSSKGDSTTGSKDAETSSSTEKPSKKPATPRKRKPATPKPAKVCASPPQEVTA